MARKKMDRRQRKEEVRLWITRGDLDEIKRAVRLDVRRGDIRPKLVAWLRDRAARELAESDAA